MSSVRCKECNLFRAQPLPSRPFGMYTSTRGGHKRIYDFDNTIACVGHCGYVLVNTVNPYCDTVDYRLSHGSWYSRFRLLDRSDGVTDISD